MRTPVPATNDSRRAYYQQLEQVKLAPLWEVLRGIVLREPVTAAAPALWRFAEVLPFLMQAGELICAEEAQRRVLILENPAMPGQSSITRTLYAGLQLILPGEAAPSHRHTQCALRFVMQGDGACTVVEGKRVSMRPWDLILTPSWTWHEHANDSSEPMVWLDGLDIPLVAALDASFAEHSVTQSAPAPSAQAGDSWALYGSNVRPVRRSALPPGGGAKLITYPYSRWRESLETLRRHEHWDSHDGVRLEFIDPADGGTVMPTVSAFTQLIPAGFATQRMRSTDGAVFVVVEGRGVVEIGAQRFELAPRDIFVVPAWHSRRWSAQEDLVLFSYSDKATQQKLGLWREHLD